jgi:collagenase-like PrtC family protease
LLEQRLAILDGMLAKENRQRDDLLIHVSPAMEAMNSDTIKAFSALGADQVILPVMASNTEKLRERALRALELVAA